MVRAIEKIINLNVIGMVVIVADRVVLLIVQIQLEIQVVIFHVDLIMVMNVYNQIKDVQYAVHMEFVEVKNFV